jgi:hypothetical protein
MSLLHWRRCTLGCGWSSLGNSATLERYLTMRVVLLSHITSGFILPWDPGTSPYCVYRSVYNSWKRMSSWEQLSEIPVGRSAKGLCVRPSRKKIAQLSGLHEYIVHPLHGSGKSRRYNIGVFAQCSYSRRKISRILRNFAGTFCILLWT